MTYRVSIRERLRRMEEKTGSRRTTVYMATVVNGKYRIFDSVTQRDIGSFDERTFSMWLEEVEANGSIVFIDDILNS